VSQSGDEKQKLLIIVYDRAIEEDMMRTIQSLNVTGYTKLFGAHGLGGRGMKQGDPIFPGLNNILIIQTNEGDAHKIVKAVREMQSQYILKPGITIWSMDVQVL